MFMSGWVRMLGGTVSTHALVCFPSCLSLSAAVIIGLTPTPSKSSASDVNCTVLWSKYIERIGQMIEPLGENFPLLFVDRSGHVFDCLNVWNDPQLLNIVEVIETSLPIDRETPIPNDPSQWPVNVCSNGSGSWDGKEYFKVMLPSEVEILESESCQNRVFRGIERLLK
jgi:hypothetical protein